MRSSDHCGSGHDDEQQLGETPIGPQIIAVTKSRALRRIKVDGLGVISQIPSQTAFSDRGVNVELTWLKVAGAEYWSLGLEAFPDDSAMSAGFTEVADRFFEQLKGVQLDMSNCDSYASWLARIKA